MATSEVQIVNSAFLKIGEERIVSLDDEALRAVEAKEAYPINRDYLLRQYRWNFAIKRATLPADPTPPAFGFASAFQLPNDLLTLIGVYDENEPLVNYTSTRCPFKVEGNRILAENADELPIFYIRKVTNVAQFDVMFDEALALRLAVDMAYRLSTGLDRVSQLKQAFDEVIKQAKTADAFEGKPEMMVASDWLDSRGSHVPAFRAGPITFG